MSGDRNAVRLNVLILTAWVATKRIRQALPTDLAEQTADSMHDFLRHYFAALAPSLHGENIDQLVRNRYLGYYAAESSEGREMVNIMNYFSACGGHCQNVDFHKIIPDPRQLAEMEAKNPGSVDPDRLRNLRQSQGEPGVFVYSLAVWVQARQFMAIMEATMEAVTHAIIESANTLEPLKETPGPSKPQTAGAGPTPRGSPNYGPSRLFNIRVFLVMLLFVAGLAFLCREDLGEIYDKLTSTPPQSREIVAVPASRPAPCLPQQRSAEIRNVRVPGSPPAPSLPRQRSREAPNLTVPASPRAPSISGLVLKVDNESGLVMISVGKDHGVTERMTFEVVRPEPRKYVGRIWVYQLGDQVAYCLIDRIMTKDAIQERDYVATGLE
jgi:hypothetical protein